MLFTVKFLLRFWYLLIVFLWFFFWSLLRLSTSVSFFSRWLCCIFKLSGFLTDLIIFKFKFSFYDTLFCQILLQHLLQCLYKYHMFLCIQWNYLYPYNTVAFFLHILVLQNHVKTHMLLFYLSIVLIDLDILVYSWVFEFVHFYRHHILCKRLYTMIIWFWH